MTTDNQILVADDDPLSREALKSLLKAWDYRVVECQDGGEAWQTLQQEETLSLAIFDWQMPGVTGPEICRLARTHLRQRPLYLIVLTALRTGIDALVQAFEAGADDYLNKPFEPRELQARLHVGKRMIQLQRELALRVKELETSLATVKRLQGLLPICCICKRIRNDKDYWQEVETYLAEHSEVLFSHSYCPDCIRRHYGEFADRILGPPKT